VGGEPTELIAIIHDRFLDNVDAIYEHFSSARRSADNQELPGGHGRLVPVKHVKAIHSGIEAIRTEIETLCRNRNQWL
jgi:hypothetical protein